MQFTMQNERLQFAGKVFQDVFEGVWKLEHGIGGSLGSAQQEYDRNLGLLESLEIKEQFEEVAEKIRSSTGKNASVVISPRPHLVYPSGLNRPEISGSQVCLITLEWEPTDGRGKSVIAVFVRTGDNLLIRSRKGDREFVNVDEVAPKVLTEALFEAYKNPLDFSPQHRG